MKTIPRIRLALAAPIKPFEQRAGRQMPISCPVVPDLVWAEIDDSSHLERARREVYPQLSD